MVFGILDQGFKMGKFNYRIDLSMVKLLAVGPLDKLRNSDNGSSSIKLLFVLSNKLIGR